MDEDLAEELRAAIGDFVRRVRLHDRMPRGQAAVLGHLDRTGPLSIADLARREHVKHQTMTRTVHLLHDRALVMLSPDEQDRRRQVVTITESGRRTLDDERRHRASGIARAIRDDLDDDEREVVRRIPEILAKLRP
ncbi:MarR family winged helix-turn-helix transcriptional regulator [Actinoallomurus iriomotensis]|uniref:MarR family transcriptional regulator n=1 Tax=Actinoallomurus iriomotensis TaxID=478107 RepID=A0A9W6S4M1_9ACTN|nr:MarR family transcriptional regulator [Actinoallomurus iriomotensis]GLY88526.1 MarR family transcriptional regulator [Actinoallomurus iriomotensis]